MATRDLTPAELKERKHRRRERIAILIILAVVIGLTYFETQVIDLGMELPVANSVLIFALININAILLLLILFLIGRNIIKLVFERKSKAMGAKLKTKLVVSFMALSLVPTLVLFFATLQFFSTSIEYWFNIQLDKALQESLHVGRLYYQTSTQEAVALGQELSRTIAKRRLLAPERRKRLAAFLEAKRKEYRLSSIKAMTADLDIVAVSTEPDDALAQFTSPSRDLITDALAKGKPQAEITASALGDWLSAVVPVMGPKKDSPPQGALIIAKLTPEGLLEKLGAISRGLEGYQQLKMIKGPIKVSHYITLSIVTMLIMFAATWFGFRLARSITEPLQELAEGTQRVAAGDYDFTIEPRPGDEIAVVIDSFNQMTQDLKSSKEELERTNLELIATNREIEERRSYMESVLANIAGGVFSVDGEGRVTTINKSAARLLGRRAEQAVGKHYSELLPAEYAELFDSLAEAVKDAPGGRLERHIRLTVGETTVSLLLRLTSLKDPDGKDLGIVTVIEDLTQLEKAQRMAAWREVARRIAHEIKNPLTPIKLSAQRLQRRFGGQVEEAEIFDQAVSTIIGQTDALKALVDEFSSFARMPAVNLSRGDLVQISREVVRLFQEAHKTITFDLVTKTPPPPFYFDPDQMKRVLINLLDNSVAALEEMDPVAGDGKRVTIRLNYLNELKTARLEVADNGPGIPPADKARLFEPYFSTKKQGTGLGLAIVSTIIQDHNGYIRVQDNAPRGVKFIIELPVSGWSSDLEVDEHGSNHTRG